MKCPPWSLSHVFYFKVLFCQFMDYFRDLSAAIENEEYFEAVALNLWTPTAPSVYASADQGGRAMNSSSLSGGSCDDDTKGALNSSSSNTNRRRALVTHPDGVQEVGDGMLTKRYLVYSAACSDHRGFYSSVASINTPRKYPALRPKLSRTWNLSLSFIAHDGYLICKRKHKHPLPYEKTYLFRKSEAFLNTSRYIASICCTSYNIFPSTL